MLTAYLLTGLSRSVPWLETLGQWYSPLYKCFRCFWILLKTINLKTTFDFSQWVACSWPQAGGFERHSVLASLIRRPISLWMPSLEFPWRPTSWPGRVSMSLELNGFVYEHWTHYEFCAIKMSHWQSRLLLIWYVPLKVSEYLSIFL